MATGLLDDGARTRAASRQGHKGKPFYEAKWRDLDRAQCGAGSGLPGSNATRRAMGAATWRIRRGYLTSDAHTL